MSDLSYVWPLKYVKVDAGLLCIYDHAFEEPENPKKGMDVEVNYLGEEWVIVVNDQFCVPVKPLDVQNSNNVSLYLAGSKEDDLDAPIFATIPLDIRALSKITVIMEMGEPRLRQPVL